MGELLALLSGFSFATSNVYTRRGIYFAREAFSPLPISMGIGIILFLILIVINGDIDQLSLLSWIGILSFSAAGIVHFVIGRSLNYNSLRLIGANRAAPLLAANVLLATTFGMIFLHEHLSLLRALGICTIFLGLVLIGTSAERGSASSKIERRVLFKGMALGLGAGMCYGISPLFVKIGFREIGSPFAGGLVSYAAAGLIVLIFLAKEERRRGLGKLTKSAFFPMLVGGTTVALAQIFRYIALGFAPINVVAPLIATNNIYVPFLSFLVNRKMEVFSVKVLGGTAAVIVGVLAVLLF